jgi:diguanylate cyclase (GGDEF)-like protein
MKKVLVVEDDKILAKLLAKNLEMKLHFDIDVAYSLHEARLFARKYKYFLALLDLNLPDAHSGEIVDVILDKKIPSIVLSGILDKKIRDMVSHKDIIDYIEKGGIEEIRYLISRIDRLDKNTTYKVLIVTTSPTLQDTLQSIVEHLFFQTIVTQSSKEALQLLKTNPEIKIVLIDYNIPETNGLELTKKIRKQYSKNELSILAFSSDATKETPAQFLKHGANDYLHAPFLKEEFACRLTNAIDALDNILSITQNANRDFLTGLYNRRYFFEHIQQSFYDAKFTSKNVCIAMVDIDNFKNINDTYGHETGDDVIVYVSKILTRNTDAKDTVARFGGEEFCIVFNDIAPETAFQRCEMIRKKIAEASITEHHIIVTVSIGLSLELSKTLNDTINDADTLLYKAKKSGKNQVIVD